LIFLFIVFKKNRQENKPTPYNLPPTTLFILILFSFGLFLTIIPEFFYIKDIYPAHFRANTMFKLGYQAFSMMGIASIVTFYLLKNIRKSIIYYLISIIFTVFLFFPSIYPYFSVPSYYGALNRPVQLDGQDWLKTSFLEDNEIILGSSPMANLIPAFSAKKVYIGHGHQTADWLEKKDKVNNLFFASNTADGLKEDWLESQRIDYLFFSSREDLLGDFNPFEKKYLQLVWQEGQAAIFKVVVNSGNNLSN